MKQVLFAVLLSALVWPGAGQIYNREFTKGLILIGLTLLFGLSLLINVGREIAQNLPPDMIHFDIAQARALSEDILSRNSGFLLTFNTLMFVTWIYSIVDAFLGARDKLKPQPPETPTAPEDSPPDQKV